MSLKVPPARFNLSRMTTARISVRMQTYPRGKLASSFTKQATEGPVQSQVAHACYATMIDDDVAKPVRRWAPFPLRASLTRLKGPCRGQADRQFLRHARLCRALTRYERPDVISSTKKPVCRQQKLVHQDPLTTYHWQGSLLNRL